MTDPQAPLPERTISDIETLKALSDPVRLRILEAMAGAPHETWTVKRLATALGVGPTKLYHHVGVLEERDLIRVAGTRVVSGIIETSYRIAQLSLRLDRSLLTAAAGGDAATAAVDEVIGSIFETARDDVARAIRSGAMQIDATTGSPERGMLAQGLARLRPEKAAEFRARLAALVAEYDGSDPAGQPFGLLVAYYPMPETLPPTDEESATAKEPGDD